MRRGVLLIGGPMVAALMLIAGQAEQQARSGISRATQASYAFGMDIARSLKNLSADLAFSVDIDAFVRGVQDEFLDRPRLLTEEDARKLRNSLVRERNERRKVLADESEKRSRAFLAQNRSKPGVLATASGLQYEVLHSGTGQNPGPDDTVTVHCSARLLDGTMITDSHERGEPEMHVVRKALPGFVEGVQLMHVGARFRLFVPPHLAYGTSGKPPTVPPNEMIVFDIELLAVHTAAKAPKDTDQGENRARP